MICLNLQIGRLRGLLVETKSRLGTALLGNLRAWNNKVYQQLRKERGFTSLSHPIGMIDLSILLSSEHENLNNIFIFALHLLGSLPGSPLFRNCPRSSSKRGKLDSLCQFRGCQKLFLTISLSNTLILITKFNHVYNFLQTFADQYWECLSVSLSPEYVPHFLQVHQTVGVHLMTKTLSSLSNLKSISRQLFDLFL